MAKFHQQIQRSSKQTWQSNIQYLLIMFFLKTAPVHPFVEVAGSEIPSRPPTLLNPRLKAADVKSSEFMSKENPVHVY